MIELNWNSGSLTREEELSARVAGSVVDEQHQVITTMQTRTGNSAGDAGKTIDAKRNGRFVICSIN